MPWGSIGSLGSAQSKAADQASIVLTVTATAEVGNVAVVIVTTDNAQAADGDEGDLSIQDSQGNSWTKAKEFGASGTQSAAVVGIFFSKITTQLANPDTITVNFQNATSRDASAISAWEFTIDAGNVVSVAGSDARKDLGVDPGALTISGLSSQEYLWVHCLGAEGPNTDAYTWDADYTQLNGNGTTGGGAASNIHVRGGFRIFTGTTDTVDVTSDTADRDYAQAYVALLQAAPPVGPPVGSLALMGVGR